MWPYWSERDNRSLDTLKNFVERLGRELRSDSPIPHDWQCDLQVVKSGQHLANCYRSRG